MSNEEFEDELARRKPVTPFETWFKKMVAIGFVLVFVAVSLLSFLFIQVSSKFDQVNTGVKQTSTDVLASRENNFKGRAIVCQVLYAQDAKFTNPACNDPDVKKYLLFVPTDTGQIISPQATVPPKK